MTTTVLRWVVLGLASLWALGLVGRPAPSDAMTGEAGPIRVSVLPAVGLTDGQTVAVHAESTDAGVVIYSMTAHLCVTDKVTGDRSFSFAGIACTNVPVGQSDTERTTVPGGTASADLEYKVGTGRASWLSSTGYDGQISCGPGSPCDLVLKIEVTDSTLYYRAPLCFGSNCPKDPDAPAPAPPVTPTTDTPAPPAAGDDGASTGRGKNVPSGAATASGKAGSGGGSASSSDPAASGSAQSGARLQSRVSADEPGPTVWRLRLVAATLVGAIGGIRISALIKGLRGRRAGAGALS